MSITVRCKFYVSSVETRKHEHLTGDQDVPYVTVHFNAVKSSKEGTENHAYWTASPNGGMKLSGKLSDLAQYVPGTYWFIDLTRTEWKLSGMSLMLADQADKAEYRERLNEPDVWQLRSLEAWSPDLSQLNVKLARSRPWEEVNGEFTVSISNKNVWGEYHSLGDLYKMSVEPTTKD